MELLAVSHDNLIEEVIELSSTSSFIEANTNPSSLTEIRKQEDFWFIN